MAKRARLVLFRPVVAVFIESFREGRQLVIWRWKSASSAASLSSPFGRSPIYPRDIRESRKRKAGVEPRQGGERGNGGRAESDGAEKYSYRLSSRTILSYIFLRGGKLASTAGAASRARRGVYAPATAANYVSTELNLKDRRRRGAELMIYGARRDLVSPRRPSFARETRARSSPQRHPDRQVEIAWGWYLCAD